MLKEVAKVILLAAAITLIGYVLAANYLCEPKAIYCSALGAFGEFFGAKLRGSLFAGFLTLGGFLLSLKTFIVVNMKNEVFENNLYKQEWDEQKKIDSNNKLGRLYDPLRYLSTVLFIAINSCILTAVLQLTLGLFENTFAAIVCLMAALISVLFVLRSLLLIRTNLNRMFDYLDKTPQTRA